MIRLAAMLALAPALAMSSPAAMAAEQVDWTSRVSQSPAGGYVLGNPDAKVRLVEYVSLTCGHCAHFAEEGMNAIVADYVSSGRLALELRNYVRDPADVAGALMARCGTGRYFETTEALLAGQKDWLGKLAAMPNEQLQELFHEQGLEGLATVSGMDVISAKSGLSATDRKRCLSDQPALERVVAMSKRAVEEHGVKGTPSFLINDRLVSAHDWASLKPLIDAALAE